ncbi:threonine synthase [Paludifilum halophilum]|uniref:Threonine synthase n=1 Tax=Paludifilum halophilum TaxID=1642702 RepID=A0A235B450_9BACL|nr:threonine synthase [Paludifilum halophilum]OYD06687.1 threonine synthase [Paludifilum halophilum]
MKDLNCTRCKATDSPNRITNVCKRCASPLLVRYGLDRLKHSWDRESLRERSFDMWRYRELLPVDDPEEIVSLGEGGTPALPFTRIGENWGIPRLMMKDEGFNPTGTFKARGAAAGITRAKALGIQKVAMPTAGNAGGAWAAYAAAAGMELMVAMPVDAPESNQRECLLYGADLQIVDGLISDCGKWVERAVEEEGYFNAATLKEPYRVEGKKTLGLEIAEQNGWAWPDVIVYPTGGGVGLIGIWKAVEELARIGWVTGKPPRMVAVQMEGCAPIVEAFRNGWKESRFWEGARTAASGLRVPKALGDFLALDALYRSDGTAVAVSDTTAKTALRTLARTEGCWICPEGAAGLAAIRKLRREGWIDGRESVWLMNTGTGMKDSEWAG